MDNTFYMTPPSTDHREDFGDIVENQSNLVIFANKGYEENHLA